MERRRIPYERERWIFAVLIVAAIAGVSVMVPRWPLPAPPVPSGVPAASLLPARALRFAAHPGPVIPAPPAVAYSLARSAPAAKSAAASVAVAAETATEPAVAGAMADSAAAPADDSRAAHAPELPVLVLASRRVDFVPVTTWADDDPHASVPSSSHAFVELPAVVVTRAVLVAGRGIRSGLRATGAVIRAAF